MITKYFGESVIVTQTDGTQHEIDNISDIRTKGDTSDNPIDYRIAEMDAIIASLSGELQEAVSDFQGIRADFVALQVQLLEVLQRIRSVAL